MQKFNEVKLKINTAKYGKVLKLKSSRNEALTIQKMNRIKIALIISLSCLVFFGVYLLFAMFIVPLFKELNEEVSGFIEEMDLDEEVLIVYDESDYLFIVDEDNVLSDDYEVELVEFDNVLINVIIEEALTAMKEQAQSEGVSFEIDVAYISPEEQEQLYEAKVQELIDEGSTAIMANATAQNYTEKANESDMQTGLCVKFLGDEETFSESELYLWLVKNAADYGFVFRYPSSASKYIDIEPCDLIIRYVGQENALKMRQLGICLEEYVLYLS